jgi:hypothetical protein
MLGEDAAAIVNPAPIDPDFQQSGISHSILCGPTWGTIVKIPKCAALGRLADCVGGRLVNSAGHCWALALNEGGLMKANSSPRAPMRTPARLGARVAGYPRLLLALVLGGHVRAAVAASCPSCTTLQELSACTADVNRACCRSGGCESGEPAACDKGCEGVLLPMSRTCAGFLDANYGLLPISAALGRAAVVCEASNPPTTPPPCRRLMPPTPPGVPSRVLFSGNSFTYGPPARLPGQTLPDEGPLNNLPRLFTLVSHSLGVPVITGEDTIGGCDTAYAYVRLNS